MSRAHARLHARRWGKVRRTVFQRDGWRCVQCGKAGRLECDHVTPLSVEPGQNPYDPAGLQTLCRDCHLRKTVDENRPALSPEEQEWADFEAEFL